MQPVDLKVLSQVRRWLSENRACWLCTIVSTYGSSPRPVGSLFATDGAERIGSISGGCLEDYFATQLNSGLFSSGATLYTYGKVEDIDSPLELPCGGTMRLLVERLQPDQASQFHFEQLLESVKQCIPCSRTVLLPTGKCTLDKGGAAESSSCYTADRVIQYYGQPWQVIILGASLVAEYVAKYALDCGYVVQICDNRDEVTRSWPLDDVIPENTYANIFLESQPSLKNSAVLALSHDPRVDDLGLMVALQSEAFYVGAMGSERTSLARRERLMRSGGLTEAELTSLHAPIGLPIHSKTPAEIAISILADVTLVKNELRPQGIDHVKFKEHGSYTGSWVQ